MKLFFDSIGIVERAMSFHRDRHAVLANNIANVDTPNYRAQDVSTPSFAQTAGTKATDAQHQGGADASLQAEIADDVEPNSDGNTVSLERQMAKLDANRVRYTAAGSIVSRRLALLRYIATDGLG